MKKTLLLPFLVPSLFLYATLICQAGPVTDWVTTNGNADFSSGSESTNSPVTTDADGDTIAANIGAPITLDDGRFITLTGSVFFDTVLVNNQFRVGLFDGDDPVTAGDGAGYVGIYAGAPALSTGHANLNSGDGTDENPFTDGAATILAIMPSVHAPIPGGTLIDFSLTIARNRANLDISASFSYDGTFSSSLNLQDKNVSYTIYDSVSFFMGNDQNSMVATYRNIEVTTGTIPEPSTFLLAMLGLVCVGRGKHREDLPRRVARRRSRRNIPTEPPLPIFPASDHNDRSTKPRKMPSAQEQDNASVERRRKSPCLFRRF